MSKGDHLSEKHLAFIDAYFSNGFNASAAVITAGYAPKNACVTGSQLLVNPKVKLEIEKRKAEIKKKSSITVEELIEDLKTIKNYSIGLNAKTKTMVDAKSALRAIELLGKTIGAFVDKTEVNVSSIKIIREDDDAS